MADKKEVVFMFDEMKVREIFLYLGWEELLAKDPSLLAFRNQDGIRVNIYCTGTIVIQVKGTQQVIKSVDPRKIHETLKEILVKCSN